MIAQPIRRCLWFLLAALLLVSTAAPSLSRATAAGGEEEVTAPGPADTEDDLPVVPAEAARDDSAEDAGGKVPQATDPAAADESAAGVARPPNTREASLAGVLAARRQIEADLLGRQELLRSDAARGREAEIEGEVRALSEELGKLNRNFSELASGLDPGGMDVDAKPAELNLTNEVRDLLGPLLNELKRATSRPREIDRLRTEIAELFGRLDKVESALLRLVRIEATVTNPEVLDAIESEKRDWTRRRNAIATSLKVSQQKLDQRLGDSQTISQAIENLFQLFFKSRGRNLLLALVAMFGFLVTIRRIRSFVSKRRAKLNRTARFESRIFSLISSAFTVIGALLVFLLCLYFFGDWVLLILVLLLILGLIWTSKQAIPRFWSQTVLLLDMGVVREGERLIYNDLSWRVDSISFYPTLVNPELIGGQIRLYIDDLSDLRSRPYDEEEPWFPTRTGDIILLSDGRPARVEFQSIEIVRLRSPGGNQTTFAAADFAAQSIERLSDGYRVNISFGLDYGDQAEITTSMRDTLQRGVEQAWRESKWSEALRGTSVEFQTAGASSLDMFVRVDLDGSTAFDLQAQQRALSRFCVDICNENGWVIPFTQLTLHVAPNTDANESAAANQVVESLTS